MRSFSKRLVSVGIAMVCAQAIVTAQDWSRMFREPEVENYELSMDKVRKFVDGQRAIALDPDNASKLDRDFKALQQAKPKPTLADVVGVVDKNAGIRAAIAKFGMTTQDFLLTSWAVANAGIHMSLTGRGLVPRTAAQKANVALLQQNQAEWKKLEQELVRIAEQAVKQKQ